MDWKSFWDSQRSTIISALIAIAVIAGLFVLFNALPAGQPAEPADEQKEEQTKDDSKSEKSDKKEDKNVKDTAGKIAKLPAKYIIKNSDSLWKIAQVQYGSGEKWAAIAAENSIQNPDHVLAGSEITLPKAQDYKVKAGDTLWDIAEQMYKDGFQWTKIRDANPGKIGTLPNGNVLVMTGSTIVVP